MKTHILFLFAIFAFLGCSKDDSEDNNKVTDADGNVYRTVKIGDQLWMAENLRTSKYNDGKPIKRVINSWGTLDTAAYCWYGDDSAAYNLEYGKLYNWHAVNTGKLAPKGWHVATDADWKELELFLGMSVDDLDVLGWRGNNEGGKLKEAGLVHWATPNEGAADSVDFKALPGGYRFMDNSSRDMNYNCYFWIGDAYSSSDSYYRILDNDGAQICRTHFHKSAGFSIRCVKD